MSQAVHLIKTDKKTAVLYKQWGMPPSGTVFLLVHGLGAHSGRWDFLARFLRNNNISSYALELRGFGETKGPRGHIQSFKTYYKDICRIYDIIREENPESKVYLTGESLGALICFLAVTRVPDMFDGLVCISPAFASTLKFSKLDYIRIFSALLYDPQKQFDVPFTSEMCTRDEEYRHVLNSDSREHRVATAGMLSGILAAQFLARMRKGSIVKRVLFLIAGMDKLVDTEVSKQIFRGLKAKDKTIIEYPEMFHSLSVELGREKVFEDILAWARMNNA